MKGDQECKGENKSKMIPYINVRLSKIKKNIKKKDKTRNMSATIIISSINAWKTKGEFSLISVSKTEP